MACIAAPKLPPPPGLSLLLPTLVFSTPVVGLNLCCSLETPSVSSPPIPLGAIAPAIALLLAPVVSVVMAAIDQLNALLDQAQFSCPLE